MVSGIFHSGSGVGNQLHRYVATRVLALDKGYDFSMVAPENCKVKDFMNLDMGTPFAFDYGTDQKTGKVYPNLYPGHFDNLWEEKTNYYNPEFNFIEDYTIIDGEFQDERYFGHRITEVNGWLRVAPLEVPDDVCVIGFRGGEFALFPELFLGDDYWGPAIAEMQKINPNMRFQVHTDDPVLAEKYFGGHYEVIHNVGVNWRAMRHAKFAIIANSSFYILPRLLRHSQDGKQHPNSADLLHYYVTGERDWPLTISPRYWARRNTKEWSMPQNYYKCFIYL